MPNLADYIDDAALIALVEAAKLEDLGPDGLDATSACFIDETATGSAAFVNREAGTIAGLSALKTICKVYGGRVSYSLQHSDGDPARPGKPLATITGPMRDLLAIERVALNIMTHLSGIATLTAKYVAKCEGTKANIYDTRKTLPGLRGLQKYAVTCGGGKTHRMGLYDAVLIKDNHLAGTPLGQLAEKLAESAGQARRLTRGCNQRRWVE